MGAAPGLMTLQHGTPGVAAMDGPSRGAGAWRRRPSAMIWNFIPNEGHFVRRVLLCQGSVGA